MLIFGFAMVLIMMWRPRGLIATRAPSVFLKERKAIAADAGRKEGTADAPDDAPLLRSSTDHAVRRPRRGQRSQLRRSHAATSPR